MIPDTTDDVPTCLLDRSTPEAILKADIFDAFLEAGSPVQTCPHTMIRLRLCGYPLYMTAVDILNFFDALTLILQRPRP